jgi:hypothetical protein
MCDDRHGVSSVDSHASAIRLVQGIVSHPTRRPVRDRARAKRGTRASARPVPREEDIRERAYQIYMNRVRSGHCGDAASDWMLAERELWTDVEPGP